MEANCGVSLVKNIIRANMQLSDDYHRPLINRFETSCFVFFAGCLARSVFTPEQIRDTLLIQDHLERHNCKMDELMVNNRDEMCKEDILYENERNYLCKGIHKRYLVKFGMGVGDKRWEFVDKSIKDWFNIGRRLDEFVTTGSATCQHENDVNERVGQLQKIVEDTSLPERGIVQKEIIDGVWINAVCSILTEGDESQLEEIFEPMLALTMLFQLEEDYVNIRRDRRVGKKSIFTTYDGRSFFERTKYLLNKLPKYLKKITDRPLIEKVIFAGWLGKCILAGVKSVKNGQNWRALSDYIKADNYERARLSDTIEV